MSKILIALLVSLTFLLGTNAGAYDLQKGVSHYKWGDSAATYPKMSKLNSKNDISYYSNPEEVYTIDKVSIDKVVYGFYKDQLFGVYLNTDSTEVYDELLRHMKSLYGPPSYKTTVDLQVILKWKQQDVTIKLKINNLTQKMKLAFYYRPLSNKLQTKQWEDLDTSSFRFFPIQKDKRPEEVILFEF